MDEKNVKNVDELKEYETYYSDKSFLEKVGSVFAKAGENGKIFGSITSKDIATELAKKYFVEVDKKKVCLDDAIKTLGVYNIEIKLFEGITGVLKVNVIAE